MVDRMRRLHLARALMVPSVAVVLVLASGLAWSARVSAAGGAVSQDISVQRTLAWVGYPSDASPRSFRISSESVGAPTPDAFQILYDQGTFTLDYQRDNSSLTAAHLALTFRALVEWNGTANNGQFDNASILGTVPLGPAGFGGIPVQHTLYTIPGGGELHTFLIQSNTGDVTLNLTIGERFVSLSQGKTLTPMEAKLSVEVNHTVVHDGARLGLLLEVQTPGSVRLEDTSWDDEHDFSQGDHSLNVTDDATGRPSTVFFSWQTQAEVNGIRENVSATGEPDNASNYSLYLTYGGEAMSPGSSVHVVHDPALGVVSAAYASIVPPIPALQGDYLAYAVTAAAVGALVVGSVVLAARRRGAK